MAFDLNVFRQNIGTYGTSSPNKFDVNIALPSVMRQLAGNPNFSYINFSNQIIPFRAEAVTTPGVALLTTDTNNWGVGPRIKQPFNVVISDVRVVFLADEYGFLEQYFMTWLNYIYDFSYSSDPSKAVFTANYRDDVVADNIKINKYNKSGGVVNTYTLHRALPTSVTPLNLDWNTTNATVKLLVNFNCTSFTIDVPSN